MPTTRQNKIQKQKESNVWNEVLLFGSSSGVTVMWMQQCLLMHQQQHFLRPGHILQSGHCQRLHLQKPLLQKPAEALH